MRQPLCAAVASSAMLAGMAFQQTPTPQVAFHRSTALSAQGAITDGILADRYPTFARLVSDNNDVQKALRQNIEGFTIFAPTEEAFQKLGEQKKKQLSDDRNSETRDKITSYHVVNEHVTAEELFAAGGLLTMGGEILVGRTVKGGFFGIGGQEDGGSTVGGAKVLATVEIDSCILHEVDDLISPEILWRYMDQLRIPLSQ